MNQFIQNIANDPRQMTLLALIITCLLGLLAMNTIKSGGGPHY